MEVRRGLNLLTGLTICLLVNDSLAQVNAGTAALADYGASADGFLECVPTYVHGAPALHVALEKSMGKQRRLWKSSSSVPVPSSTQLQKAVRWLQVGLPVPLLLPRAGQSCTGHVSNWCFGVRAVFREWWARCCDQPLCPADDSHVEGTTARR